MTNKVLEAAKTANLEVITLINEADAKPVNIALIKVNNSQPDLYLDISSEHATLQQLARETDMPEILDEAILLDVVMYLVFEGKFSLKEIKELSSVEYTRKIITDGLVPMWKALLDENIDKCYSYAFELKHEASGVNVNLAFTPTVYECIDDLLVASLRANIE